MEIDVLWEDRTQAEEGEKNGLSADRETGTSRGGSLVRISRSGEEKRRVREKDPLKHLSNPNGEGVTVD